MSRSSFAERFTELVAMSPMQYVTGWRMQQANDMLMSSTLSTAQIAETCGYNSESSFSKAFKKQFDKGPGAVRRELRGPSGKQGKREQNYFHRCYSPSLRYLVWLPRSGISVNNGAKLNRPLSR